MVKLFYNLKKRVSNECNCYINSIIGDRYIVTIPFDELSSLIDLMIDDLAIS
jgi:hypothetical protein